ncbi:unnamed protein product [Bursaphelenchus okinawaensis]|uniref:Serine/threonine-protein phosphatase n=1 Tax=Bursaphelenchus okinawaensis TaxID=465554 RepID=A0A811LNT4_9BILA|nr:unnamed protein product [Bursaphelenchus okinawaensis]CAG9127344.1 unnamed protein product [Bursaphelenchus okinawaensis]
MSTNLPTNSNSTTKTPNSSATASGNKAPDLAVAAPSTSSSNSKTSSSSTSTPGLGTKTTSTLNLNATSPNPAPSAFNPPSSSGKTPSAITTTPILDAKNPSLGASAANLCNKSPNASGTTSSSNAKTPSSSSTTFGLGPAYSNSSATTSALSGKTSSTTSLSATTPTSGTATPSTVTIAPFQSPKVANLSTPNSNQATKSSSTPSTSATTPITDSKASGTLCTNAATPSTSSKALAPLSTSSSTPSASTSNTTSSASAPTLGAKTSISSVALLPDSHVSRKDHPTRRGSVFFDTAIAPADPPPPIPRAVTPFPFDILGKPTNLPPTPTNIIRKNYDRPGLPETATADFNNNVGPTLSLKQRNVENLKLLEEKLKGAIEAEKVVDDQTTDRYTEDKKGKVGTEDTVKLQNHRDAGNTTESPLKEDAEKAPKLDVNGLIYKLMNSVTLDDKGNNMIVADNLTDPGVIEQIIIRAIDVLKKLPSMLKLNAPMYIVGDIHGQFTDLLRIFAMCGNPSETFYLFLGDYVDRGPHSLEVICLLLLLKVRYPWRMNMLRGNHECSAVNRTYGFSDECEQRFQHIPVSNTVWGVKAADMKGTQVWYRFQDVFNWLPFCALINGRILCMHGGLSPNLQKIQQLEALKRPIDPCEAGLHIDLLWSDPDPKLPCREMDPQFGPSNRGISSHFNQRAVMDACRNLNLDMVVRAHQVVQDGYEFFAQRHLVTLFSAPNYCGQYNNAGAIMQIDANLMISFKQLRPVSGTPCRKKTKSTDINFDDIDLDALCSEDEAAAKSP